ncbi:hypothetical protein HY086_04875 [Candidatus Gottesmanbacteria bacterium]|nr:hypothetical protein [Candidatus Gottesmanbacteria bacterium]
MIDSAQPQKSSNIASDQPTMVGTGGAGGKELEVASSEPVEVPALKEVGHEVPLKAEVSGAGVKIHPTTVAIPQKVSQMGVTAVGQASPLPTVTVTLPLTDDQIAQGLHASITSSWRWLAEWCVRKLKQLHRKITSPKSQ